uniref:Bacterial mobilisation domain-containing protein n=1 Tax=Enterovibrio norvegicus TaxID=188144 RepID=A0A0H3ZW05_9GAMM|nr:hypothetical protein [Enterovibrio norvegicus]
MSGKNRNFRLNEVEESFDLALMEAIRIDPKIDASKFLRYCIRKSLNEQSSMSPDDAKKLLLAVIDLKKEISKVGGNLNQIAHYFNIHDHLIESELRRQHEGVMLQLKQTTLVLSEVLNGLRRSTI